MIFHHLYNGSHFGCHLDFSLLLNEDFYPIKMTVESKIINLFQAGNYMLNPIMINLFSGTRYGVI